MTKKDSYILFSFLLISIALSIYLRISLFYAFVISIGFSLIILKSKGFKISDLVKMMKSGIYECKNLYILIIFIGATVSIWLSSGVVPAMIYYGFDYMKGMNFLLSAFLIISVISFFMGTAVGTISTVGVALLGIGKGFNMPMNILLGALVSGAFIADKMSPISGLFNLTLTSVQIEYKKSIKSMMVTLVPAYLITSIVYYILGLRYQSNIDLSAIEYYRDSIYKSFRINPYLLLVPILIVILVMTGVKILKAIPVGLLVGSIITLFVQEHSITAVVKYILFGYKGNTTSVELNDILVSGGMVSMVQVVMIVIGAIAISSIFEGSGAVDLLLNKIDLKEHSKRKLVFKTGIISSFLTIVTCDQTVGIVLPARRFRTKYDEIGLNRSILVRTISDTGTIIAPLFPWNINSLIILLISGISATSYGPFAVLCYICPAITFIAAIPQKNKKKSNHNREKRIITTG